MIGAVMLATAGCGTAYDHIEIFVIGGDRRSEASPSGVRIGEGGVVVIEARAVPAEEHSDYTGLESFELRMSDPRVARVRRGVLRNSWVINGADPGDTDMQVRIDGDLEYVIPVRVERQP
jgi:hypothetical protein